MASRAKSSLPARRDAIGNATFFSPDNPKSLLDFEPLICSLASYLNDLMQFPKSEIEALWCPWRVEYFEQETPNPDFLSDAARASDDAAHLVVTRRKNAFLMMNRYPYSVGHLMAVPYRKTSDASSLGENEVLELWNLALHGQRLLRETMKAQGFNVGLNLGQCAGAGVPDHLHLHIVPRWSGDTNFMPIFSDARLFSEGLQALYDKLAAAQARLAEAEAPRS
jgi:ATP adenylyltransferase